MMVHVRQENAIAITVLPSLLDQKFDLIVVGGGAAGFMAAITAAEGGVASVLILEATSKPLEKVLMSGGGRCNVTNASWDPRDLVANYPRGSLELLGPFSRFASGDAVSWFAEHGVELVDEEDGRMFPVANTSTAVVAALNNSAKDAGVFLKTHMYVSFLKRQQRQGFLVQTRSGMSFFARKVLLATGGHPSGKKIANDLGHKIVSPVPSLFTLTLMAPWLTSCAGIALDDVELNLSVGGQMYKQLGRVLITHRGMSGPAILRLTAFSARALHDASYKSELIVNWLGGSTLDTQKEYLSEFRHKFARRTMGTFRPFLKIPKRVWLALLNQAECDPHRKWAECSVKNERSILKALFASHYKIISRGPFGEEFVTAGGVELAEVNFKTMESRVSSGLYFAGELLNIDGVTGGFNFQHCWTSGWLAGKDISFKINQEVAK